MDASTLLENQRQQSNKPAALLFLSVATGITVDRFASIPFAIVCAIGATCLITWLAAVLFFRPRNVVGTSLLLIGFAISAGAALHHAYWRDYQSNEIGLYANENPTPVCLNAIVVKQPEFIPAPPLNIMDRQEIGDRSRIELSVLSIRDQTQEISVTGKAIVTVNGEITDLQAGQVITLFGQMSRPATARSEGDFDLRDFYRTKRINVVVFVNHTDAIQLTGRIKSGYQLTRMIDRCRDYFYQTIKGTLSPANANLLSAVLLGKRKLIDREQNEKFLTTGTMHLLAISGLHVGILCSLPFLLIRIAIFDERWILIFVIVFVIFYAMLTGLRPPVVRATILIVLFCSAKLINKKPLSVNSLAFAGIIVVSMNPASLFQTGTQLSFLAVATLIVVNERIFSNRPDRNSLERFLFRKRRLSKRLFDFVIATIRTVAISSFSIWLITIPLVAENFHVVSPIGIIANLFLMIPIWFTLQAGFALMLLGNVPLVGQMLSTLCEFCLDHIQMQVNFYDQVQFGHWWSFGFGPFWLAVFYGGFSFFFLFGRFQLPLRWIVALGAIWLALAMAVPEVRSANKEKELVVTFIDVGHGTSVLIEYPNGRVVLYDAGSLNSSTLAANRVSAVLWSKKIYDLDAVVLSHADLDHYNGVPQLENRFAINQFLVSPFMFQELRSGPLRYLNELGNEKRIPFQSITTQSILNCDDDCKTFVLHPTRNFESDSDNAKSIVLLLEFDGMRILLTGDLELEGQTKLLGLTPIDCDIILSPHHGSLSTNHFSIAEWSSPEHVVISCAKEKVRQSVIDDYLRFDANVYQTSNVGTIEFRCRKNRIQVKPFLLQ